MHCSSVCERHALIVFACAHQWPIQFPLFAYLAPKAKVVYNSYSYGSFSLPLDCRSVLLLTAFASCELRLSCWDRDVVWFQWSHGSHSSSDPHRTAQGGKQSSIAANCICRCCHFAFNAYSMPDPMWTLVGPWETRHAAAASSVVSLKCTSMTVLRTWPPIGIQ